MKKIIGGLIVILLMLNIAPIVAYGADRVMKARIDISDSLLLEGVYNSYEIPFTIEDDMEFQKGEVNLDFDVSEIMEYKYSAMVVYLNGNPIATYNLYPIKGKNNKVKIQFDNNLINKGRNIVSIRTFHRIAPTNCDLDEVNIANWINLNKESFIEFSYKELGDKISLNKFPKPFMSDYNKEKFYIVVSDDLNINECNAAVNLINSMKKIRKQKIDNYEIIPLKQYDSSQKNIFVMEYTKLPLEIIGYIGDVSNEVNGKALIKEIAPKSLIITSMNTEKLIEATKALGDEKILKNSNDKLVVENYLENNKISQEDVASFKDLGYGTETLYGKGKLDFNYYYRVPDNKELIGGSIDLVLGYSPNINYTSSKISVKLNGVIQGEYSLNQEKNNRYKINIPLDQNDIQSAKGINLQVSIILDSIESCINAGDKLLQGTVYNESRFVLKTKKRNDNKIDSYRGIFAEDSKVDMVIPRDLLYVNIASSIGESIENNINLIYSDSTHKVEDSAIILGTPNNNILIKNLNEKSNLKFDDTYKTYLNNGKLGIIEGNSENISTIEIMKSPWNRKGNLVVLKSTNNDNILRDYHYLSDEGYSDLLKSKEVSISSAGINLVEENMEKSKVDWIRGYLVGNRSEIMKVFLFTIIIIIGISLFNFIRKRVSS